MDHSDSIVRRNSYKAIVNPEMRWVEFNQVFRETQCHRRNEPYVLLFSCMNTNGSMFMLQWKRTPGLQNPVQKGQVFCGEFEKRHTRHANSTGNLVVMGGDRRTGKFASMRGSTCDREEGRTDPRIESAHIAIPERVPRYQDYSGTGQSKKVAR